MIKIYFVFLFILILILLSSNIWAQAEYGNHKLGIQLNILWDFEGVKKSHTLFILTVKYLYLCEGFMVFGISLPYIFNPDIKTYCQGFAMQSRGKNCTDRVRLSFIPGLVVGAQWDGWVFYVDGTSILFYNRIEIGAIFDHYQMGVQLIHSPSFISKSDFSFFGMALGLYFP